MSEDRVRIDVADHVATVTLTRADKHNALDRAMFEAIIARRRAPLREPGVRAVVLHGEGPSFCSGLDLASLVSSDAGSTRSSRRCARTRPIGFSALPTTG